MTEGPGRAVAGEARRALRTRRAVRAVAMAAALTGALAGCGIRTTSVPVDAGAAPSRMSCAPPARESAAQARPGTLPVRVYLVCASALEAVERTVPVRETAADTRVSVASALLDALESEPSADELEAGFSTSVRGPLTVKQGRSGDPKGTLRLSREPEDLPPTALAQIVCTFAGSAAVANGGLVLGGPGDYEPRAYRCTEATQQRPESVLSSVTPAVAATSAVRLGGFGYPGRVGLTVPARITRWM
ncbi:hypothetical protein [Streptomyces sp. NPDC127084]|uniref:hypothetical protein n=1 Tax=Streptomyces sp. NPDC127084 TaxID=3347133 RepID=UPI003668BB41